jgi:hypothetical protein
MDGYDRANAQADVDIHTLHVLGNKACPDGRPLLRREVHGSCRPAAFHCLATLGALAAFELLAFGGGPGAFLPVFAAFGALAALELLAFGGRSGAFLQILARLSFPVGAVGRAGLSAARFFLAHFLALGAWRGFLFPHFFALGAGAGAGRRLFDVGGRAG